MSVAIYDLFRSPTLVLESDINDQELSDAIKKGTKHAKFLSAVIAVSTICTILFSVVIYGFEIKSKETILLLYFGLFVSGLMIAVSIIVGLINIYLYLIFTPLIKDNSDLVESMSEKEVLLAILSEAKKREPQMINDIVTTNSELPSHEALASRVSAL